MAEITFPLLHTFKARPADVAPDAVIFNAPRPLYGTDWRGEFLEGVHYAAIGPGDLLAATFAEENRKLKAVVVEYVDFHDALKWVESYAAENGYVGTLTDAEVRNMYLAAVPLPKTVTIAFAE